MSEPRILQIRDSIHLAREKEAQENTLRRFLDAKVPELHHSITLPQVRPTDALFMFVADYIEKIPDLMEAVIELSVQGGIYKHTRRFIDIAGDFFLSPPEIIKEHAGMHALIDEAYLAHRLFEEINDRVKMVCGVPLVPMDMTFANLIVHDLIGDEFANKLDMAVLYSVETMFSAEEVFSQPEFAMYAKKYQELELDKKVRKWPGLTEDRSIALTLGEETYSGTFH